MQNNRRRMREDAEEFVVMIMCKDESGNYSAPGFADKDTDIEYDTGTYGFNSQVRDNVHPMTRNVATDLAAEIVENAPAGDVLVGVVPYSTIPNEGGGFSDGDDFDDESNDSGDDEGADDAFDDFDLGDDEGDEGDEGNDDEGNDDSDDGSVPGADDDKKEEARRRFLKRVRG